MVDFVTGKGKRYKVVTHNGEPFVMTSSGHKWLCRWWGKHYCFSGPFSARVVGTLRIKAGSYRHD